MDLQQPSQPTAQILQALCFWASINLSLQGHWPAILISQNTESCGHILPRLSNSKKSFIQKGGEAPVQDHLSIHLCTFSRPEQAQPCPYSSENGHIKSKLTDVHTPECDLVPLEITRNRTTRNACHDGIFSVTSYPQEEVTIPTTTKAELMAECSPLSFSALLLLCCGALRKTLKVRFLVIPASVCISVK